MIEKLRLTPKLNFFGKIQKLQIHQKLRKSENSEFSGKSQEENKFTKH